MIRPSSPVLAALAVGALALSLTACASTPTTSVTTSAMSSAPLPVENYDWHYNEDGDDAWLAYGVAESDDLKLGLECRRASGALGLNAMAPENAKPEIYLEAGGETERFAAEAEPSMLDDGVFLTARGTTGQPIFRRFRQVGWMALWRDGERLAFAPHPQSASAIERFFVFCG